MHHYRNLTHYHESNILKLWLNDCKSSSRAPNTVRLSAPRAPAKCRLPNGSDRRSIEHIVVSRWARSAKSSKSSVPQRDAIIPRVTSSTCWRRSRWDTDRVPIRDFGINRILSFDSGFDGFPGIARRSEEHTSEPSHV